MSKMDNLRAMREARYDQAVARGAQNGGSTPNAASSAQRPAAAPSRSVPTTGTTRTTPSSPTVSERAVLAVVPDLPESEPEPEEALCGHRNMGGRTCTREAGHAAKSHRYS